jgi:hypothetical protein
VRGAGKVPRLSCETRARPGLAVVQPSAPGTPWVASLQEAVRVVTTVGPASSDDVSAAYVVCSAALAMLMTVG